MSIEGLIESYYAELLSEEALIVISSNYLAAGGGLNEISGSSGMGLIHLAVEEGLLSFLQWLLDQGAEIDLKNSQGWTPFLLAVDGEIDSAIQNETDVAFPVTKVLIERGAELTASSDRGLTAQSIVRQYGGKAEEAYEKLLNEIGCA